MVVKESAYNKNLRYRQLEHNEKDTSFVAVECGSTQTIRCSMDTNKIASQIQVFLKGHFSWIIEN